MTKIEILFTVFMSSSVLVALIRLYSDRLKRRDNVQDTSTGMKQKMNSMSTRIDEVEKKVDLVGRDTKLVMRSQKAIAFDRIRHLGLSYIRKGRITAEELQSLIIMYEAYIAFGKDSFLKKVMDEVKKLPSYC